MKASRFVRGMEMLVMVTEFIKRTDRSNELSQQDVPVFGSKKLSVLRCPRFGLLRRKSKPAESL